MAKRLLTNGKCLPKIIVHGGVRCLDPKSDPQAAANLEAVTKAADFGFKCLEKGSSSMDAVEEAVNYLESNENFNAGYGSALSCDGSVHTDAAIMQGKGYQVGCVSGVTDLTFPISLARKVAESCVTHIASDSVMRFAKKSNVRIPSPGSLASPSAVADLKYLRQNNFSDEAVSSKYKSGVGAVAIDETGNITAGSSGNGSYCREIGEIGEPAVGAGTYVDQDIGGISVAGEPHCVVQYCLALRILEHINYTGESDLAAEKIIRNFRKDIGKHPLGAIYIDCVGGTHYCVSAPQMPWACRSKEAAQSGNEVTLDWNELPQQAKKK